MKTVPPRYSNVTIIEIVLKGKVTCRRHRMAQKKPVLKGRSARDFILLYWLLSIEAPWYFLFQIKLNLRFVSY
jgi:hypothetical protein